MSKTMNRFAHLVGLRATAEEPDSDEQNAGNEDQDNNAGDEGQDPEDPKDQNGRARGKKARRAEEDPKDPDAEEDNDPDAEDDGDGDDESDAEDQEDDTTAKARAREQGRCAAIFGSRAAAKNLALAAELAFGTKLPRSQAIRLLQAGSIAQTNTTSKRSKTAAFDARMARSRQSLSVGIAQQNQNVSKTAMKANQILQSAVGTGVVKKERQ